MSYENPRKQRGERPESISLEGRSFTFVTGQRRNNSAIYASPDAFLRIGSAERILHDVVLHKRMEEQGFPVPKILHEGEYGDQHYFIESSLGPSHLGSIFSSEVAETGVISTESFLNFVTVAEQFARAQLRTQSTNKDFATFSKGILLDRLCEELPDSAERIRARFDLLVSNMSHIPFVLTHGDFNPHNLYPAGVIDFEDSFHGPYGYDIVSAITHIDYLPDGKEYEHVAGYRFTDAQKKEYGDRLDAVSTNAGLPKVSDYREDFEFCRAIWLAVGIGHTPNLQTFRYDEFIRKFLS